MRGRPHALAAARANYFPAGGATVTLVFFVDSGILLAPNRRGAGRRSCSGPLGVSSRAPSSWASVGGLARGPLHFSHCPQVVGSRMRARRRRRRERDQACVLVLHCAASVASGARRRRCEDHLGLRRVGGFEGARLEKPVLSTPKTQPDGASMAWGCPRRDATCEPH